MLVSYMLNYEREVIMMTLGEKYGVYAKLRA